MAVEAYSPEGKSVLPGVAGELVCSRPFPCQPLGFWPLPGFGDDAAVEKARRRHKQSYFETFENVWCEPQAFISTVCSCIW